MSTSPEKKIVAIIGGTGAMGSPVIAALSETNQYTLRVLTRDLQGEQAKFLAKTYPNVELVSGSFTEEQTVRKLFISVYGVFCNTDNWGCNGFQNEIKCGKMIFDIAKELGVKHFVYSSLDHTQKLMANHGVILTKVKQLSLNTLNLIVQSKCHGQLLLQVHTLKTSKPFFFRKKIRTILTN